MCAALRSRLTVKRLSAPHPLMVVAIVAVVLASTGSAIAARAVTSKDIANNTIRSSDILHAARWPHTPGPADTARRAALLHRRAHQAAQPAAGAAHQRTDRVARAGGPGNGRALVTRLHKMRARQGAPEAEQLIFAVLRDLACRARDLESQARAYKRELSRLIGSLDPTLLEEPGVGPICAAKLLACDPKRLNSEAAFARCNGTAPRPASSGQTVRHRLSRGGDRQANNALHTIARIRARRDEQTRTYLDRRISEGKTPREAMRALKRHLSRSLYKKTHHRALDLIEASTATKQRCRVARRYSLSRPCKGPIVESVPLA